MGRRSKYYIIQENIEKIKEWARAGFTNEEIYKSLKLSKDTFYQYLKKYPDFSDTLKNEKSIADYVAVQSLYKRVTGYEYTEEHTEYITDDKGKKILGVKSLKKVKKQIAPDVTAQIFWLCNRKRDIWKRMNDFDKINSETDIPKVPEFDDMTDEELTKYIENAKDKDKEE